MDANATCNPSCTKEKFYKELNDFRIALGINKIGLLEKAIREEIASILETDPVQSLQYRYQLGLLHKVYNHNLPHTRLDHTIGVVAKCIVACDIINQNTREKDQRQISVIDAKELAVAAALHDCGHLPISHATERAFLTTKGVKYGMTHEERGLPLIVNKNPIFEDLQNIVLSWPNFNDLSLYKIGSIISPEMGEEYVKRIEGFILPKKAIQQLLSSEIDMDRLDYIIRDSDRLNYYPVKLIFDKIVQYVKGLSLVKSKILGEGSPDDNAELCLSNSKIENVFYLLVSRVLLYKYVYFSEKVRSFEAILTYLVGTLIEKEISIEPIKLIAMSDKEFIDEYLEKIISYLDDDDLKEHLVAKYVNVLKFEKVERFHLFISLNESDIGNPRLKEEFIKNINKRNYIDNLRNYLFKSALKKEIKLERSDILIDVFHLKTGGGDLLVRNDEKLDLKGEGEYRTLKDYMNGSNMHRLCSEIRLDIYMKSDIGDSKKEFVKERIYSFFKFKLNET